VAGRLEVIWAALYQALQRLSMLAAWWPFLLLLLAAAWGDGWVRRRVRQSEFAYASPLAHAYALRSIVAVLIAIGLLLFLPLSLPAIGVPIVGTLLATLVGVIVGNAQKRF
jgi:tetrahydromethanopterin S-methyltransferase subunit C